MGGGCAGERGIALIVALLATLVLSALGVSLLMTTGTETLIAANYRDGVEALHAADAMLERVMPEIAAVPAWNVLLASSGGIVSGVTSSFGDAALSASLADGRTLNLVKATNLLNCPQVFPPLSTPCTAAQMDHSAGERPWGSNNPRWRLYAHGRLSALVPGLDSPFYVAAWIADDPAETDGNPATDGSGAWNPGAGFVQVRAAAFGSGGAQRSVEATIVRAGGGVRIVSWRLVR